MVLRRNFDEGRGFFDPAHKSLSRNAQRCVLTGL
jgi:hypothetical protein